MYYEAAVDFGYRQEVDISVDAYFWSKIQDEIKVTCSRNQCSELYFGFRQLFEVGCWGRTCFDSLEQKNLRYFTASRHPQPKRRKHFPIIGMGQSKRMLSCTWTSNCAHVKTKIWDISRFFPWIIAWYWDAFPEVRSNRFGLEKCMCWDLLLLLE